MPSEVEITDAGDTDGVGEEQNVNGKDKRVEEKEGTSKENGTGISTPANDLCEITTVENDAPMEDDNDSDEFDMGGMGGFIRIRQQDDSIFEQDDDDEDFDDDDFPIPEVVFEPPPSRKRKQEIVFKEGSNTDTELIELQEDDDEKGPTYTIDPDLFGTRRRDRMPLYLLNPDDYAHDPKKQVQIRRAIITYRHHQDKKEQIIKLTEENKMLRDHISALRVKVLELHRCGCEKNKSANLDTLDVKIPVVPPRMYVRGSKPVLAVPYNRCSLSPTSFLRSPTEKIKLETDSSGSSGQPSRLSFQPIQPKPLINIGPSRLNLITSSTISSVANVNKFVSTNSSMLMPGHLTRVIANGKPTSTMTVSASLQPRPVNRFLQAGQVQIAGGTIRAATAVPLTVIKTEPGLSTLPTQSIPNPTMAVSVGGSSPATASSASRIVFAKRPGAPQPASSGASTASQLIFGTKLNRPTITQIKVEPTTTLTASQLALSNRIAQQKLSLPVVSSVPIMSSVPVMSSVSQVFTQNSGQVFRTPSGHVLRLVQGSNLRQNPPTLIQAPRVARFIPPKSEGVPLSELTKKPFESKDAAEMWKKFDDDDEDEQAIIAAINGTCPTPSKTSRKQTIGKRTSAEVGFSNLNSSTIIESTGEEIELNRYEDIVFEEAD